MNRHEATTRPRLSRSQPRPSSGWNDEAACIDEEPDVFFPRSEDGGPVDWSEARAICASCTVVEPCLTYAVNNLMDDGMWGGMAPHERKRFRWSLQR